MVIRVRGTTPDEALQLLGGLPSGLDEDSTLGWNGSEWTKEEPSTAPETQPSPEQPTALPALRVLALDSDWSSAYGGLSTFNRRLCAELAAAGAEVYCAVARFTAADEADAAAVGVRLLSAPPGTPSIDDPMDRLNRPPQLPDGVVPDAVIGHGRVTGPAAYRLTSDWFPSASRIHVVHSVPDEAEQAKTQPREQAAKRAEKRTYDERTLAASAALAVGVGPRIYGVLDRQLSRSATTRRLRLDPGFDAPNPPQRTPPPGEPPVVQLLARLEDAPLKGLDIAARAVDYAARILGEEVELLLRGVSEGGYDAVWDAVAPLVSPAVRVVSRGFSTDAEQLADDLWQSTLVVMPSRAEGFGLVGQEAIMAGTPVLISARSGLGILLRNELPQSLAEHVVLSVDDPEEDSARWGSEIAKVLANPERAFAVAAEIRGLMAKRRDWATAVGSLLDAIAQTRG